MGDAKVSADQNPETSTPATTTSKGIFRWIWKGIGLLFGRRNVDFEKRLQHLSKEEVSVHARLKRRTNTWRRLARAIVLYSILIEILVLGFAIMSTRSPDISWKLRAVRVFPVFAMPALGALFYVGCARYFRMRERKDQNSLERLRAERQARIDELKQRTNYYATQQLIQRYDLDPTAKAAAASVLAAKLGAESGLNVAFKSSDSSESSSPSSSNKRNSETPEKSGLRNRKNPQLKSPVPTVHHGFLEALEAETSKEENEEELNEQQQDTKIDDEHTKGKASGSGWIARLAAMLVGEDPSQCYALICRRCHMHNGLVPKEDFQYISYVCPHCHTMNGSRQIREGVVEGDGHAAAAAPPPPPSSSVAAAAAAAATSLLTPSVADEAAAAVLPPQSAAAAE